jgi:two-component system nitrogen regulation sensor histidine kinase GlnL
MEKQIETSSSIMEHLSIGVLVLDENNALVYMNNAAQVLLDISERKAMGAKASCFFPKSSFNIERGLKRCRELGAMVTEHLVSFDGPMAPKGNVSVSMTPITHSVEHNGGVLVELMDFNHFLHINNGETLLSQNELATDMLRGLAHEIKNPLGGIRGAAQLLSKELNEKYKDYIHVIIEEADRLRHLVDRMLGSSALPNHQEINIHVIMERVRQLVEAEASKNIIIRSDYDPSIPDIKGDKDQLIQALLNIVKNAIQAIPMGGEVILKTRIHRNFTIGEVTYRLAVKIDVTDNGPGIAEDMQPKIFYPMVTGKTDGTGLGLSIAQTNVHRHKGIIEVKSEPGRTTFSTILPIEI